MWAVFRIEFTPEALDDLRPLRKYDLQQIMAAIEAQLPHQPAEETRNRKLLRPNRLAEWELRIGAFRVFYDLRPQDNAVVIVAVGHKQGNKLFVHGEEYD